MDLKEFIREIPNFPKQGILFKDLSQILRNPYAMKEVLDQLSILIRETNCDLIVGIEARGFIFGSALACKNGLGFVPVRKKDKLPGEVIKIKYSLEYGYDYLEIQKHSYLENSKILVIDDLLATGGTVNATINLINRIGGEVVGCGFVVELEKLGGRKNIPSNIQIKSIINYV